MKSHLIKKECDMCKFGRVWKGLVVCLMCLTALAENKIPSDVYKKVIFKDDFSGDKIGKHWKFYKSESRVENGVLIGLMPKDADHNSVNQVILPPFSDVEVSMKFKFEGSPMFVVAFNDSKYKGAHAGHICRVIFKKNQITLRDGKTGNFKNEIWEKKKAGKLDSETEELLKTKSRNFKHSFESGKWYNLLVRIQKDTMQVLIDDKVVATFTSEGIAHTTKNKPALVVAKQAMHFDDLIIKTP